MKSRRGLAIASLVLGLLAIPTLGLLVVGGVVAVVLGVVALLNIRKEPSVYGGTGFAVGGIIAGAVSLLLIPVFGIIAAVAIPSLVGARTAANEASAIGHLRTIVSAEMAYAASNGDAYDTLECLAAPPSCGFDAALPFLPADGAASSKSGYRFTFVPGAPADRSANPGAVSPSSLAAFAVIAEPEEPGTSGTRIFCADATGVVRLAPESGAASQVSGGECPAGWPVL